MNTTQYEVTNKTTGKKTLIDIPSRFDEAIPSNLVLHIEQENIKDDTFSIPKDNRVTNATLIKKLTPSIKKYGQNAQRLEK